MAVRIRIAWRFHFGFSGLRDNASWCDGIAAPCTDIRDNRSARLGIKPATKGC